MGETPQESSISKQLNFTILHTYRWTVTPNENLLFWEMRESLECVSYYRAYFATRTYIFLECKDWLLFISIESLLHIWTESLRLQRPTYIKFSKPMTFTHVWWWKGNGREGEIFIPKMWKQMIWRTKSSNPKYGF